MTVQLRRYKFISYSVVEVYYCTMYNQIVTEKTSEIF